MSSNAKKPREWGNRAAGQRNAIADEVQEADRYLSTLEQQLLSGQFTRNGAALNVVLARKALQKAKTILVAAGAPIDTEAL